MAHNVDITGDVALQNDEYVVKVGDDPSEHQRSMIDNEVDGRYLGIKFDTLSCLY